MSVSPATIVKALVAAGALAVVVATGATSVGAARGGLGFVERVAPGHAAREPGPPVPAGHDRPRSGPNAGYAPARPDGWVPATPPLNSCARLPAGQRRVRLSAPTRAAKPTGRHVPGRLPPGDVAAELVLGYLPNNFYVAPGGTMGSIPPGGCPTGWRQVTPPLNPLLGGLPDALPEPPVRGPKPRGGGAGPCARPAAVHPPDERARRIPAPWKRVSGGRPVRTNAAIWAPASRKAAALDAPDRRGASSRSRPSAGSYG
ncbi:MAG: hypothetical protein U0470_02290 [Anaerolineae bacterium]